jgi:transcriptional antiterminator RfaH
MHWYLVHTKPKQENCALDNLRRQGCQCYLPTLPSEKLRQGVLRMMDEPSVSALPVHSPGTGGFGQELGAHPFGQRRQPAGELRGGSSQSVRQFDRSSACVRGVYPGREPNRLFKPGERVRLVEAPFAGIEGIYQMADGERRVMVLIELLSKQVRLRVAPASLRKVG